MENSRLPQGKYRLATQALMAFSTLIAAITLGYTAFLFSGFLGGGRSWIGISQSFLLCFGLGGLIYIPAIFAAMFTRKTLVYGAQKRAGWICVLLSLPLWGYSGAALFTGYPLLTDYPHWIWVLLVLITGLAYLFWGVATMKAAHGNVQSAPL